jgi:hypothetical protein
LELPSAFPWHTQMPLTELASLYPSEMQRLLRLRAPARPPSSCTVGAGAGCTACLVSVCCGSGAPGRSALFASLSAK